MMMVPIASPRWKKKASDSSLLQAILRKVQQGRSTQSAISAYIEDLLDDWTDDNGSLPHFENESEKEAWEAKKLGMLFRDGVEKRYNDTFVKTYRRLTGASQNSAMENLNFPDLPKQVPSQVVDAIAEAQAREAAADANLLRQMALKRL